MANTVIHFEIMGKDGAKSRKFYGDLFGWDVVYHDEMQYGIIAQPEGSGIGGGIGEDAGNPRTLFYVEVPDVQAHLDRAVEMGGTVVDPPMVIPGMVELATFKDPDGLLIGLVKNVPPE